MPQNDNTLTTNNNRQSEAVHPTGETLYATDARILSYSDPSALTSLTSQADARVITHIAGLRNIVLGEFQDAAVYFEMLAQESGEDIDLVIRNEYRSGTAAISLLIDENDRFVSQEALDIVRGALAGYLELVWDEAPLRRLHLTMLLRQIDEVERAYFCDMAKAS